MWNETKPGWMGEWQEQAAENWEKKFTWCGFFFFSCLFLSLSTLSQMLFWYFIDHNRFQSWPWNIHKIIPRCWGTLRKNKLPKCILRKLLTSKQTKTQNYFFFNTDFYYIEDFKMFKKRFKMFHLAKSSLLFSLFPC